MKRAVLIVTLSLALTSLLLVAIQCDGGAAPISTRSPDNPAPAATAAPGATQPPGGSAYPAGTTEPPKPTATEGPSPYPAPSIDAAKLLEERCSTSCHNLDRVTSANKTREEWQTTVDRMIGKGAKLTEEETVVLVGFLSKVYY